MKAVETVDLTESDDEMSSATATSTTSTDDETVSCYSVSVDSELSHHVYCILIISSGVELAISRS